MLFSFRKKSVLIDVDAGRHSPHLIEDPLLLTSVHCAHAPILEHRDDYLMLCDQDDVWLPEKIEKTKKTKIKTIKKKTKNASDWN